MAIMSVGSYDKITSAIANGDSSMLTAVSGVGKKAATKIIVELKNKIGGLGDISLSDIETSNDLIDALTSLGYKKAEIVKVIRKIPSNIKDTQSKIKWALKNMG
jgi:Holliday junction DNA helicase RuvA